MSRTKTAGREITRTSSRPSYPCIVMRGGTSRGLFFHKRDMPQDFELRDRILMAAMGGPDPRQVDGLGGADLLLSKAVTVGPSEREAVDVDCTFFSIPPGKQKVAKGANCGNLISAVALFAVEEGIVTAEQGEAQVRVYNTDSDTLVEARIRDGTLGLPRLSD